VGDDPRTVSPAWNRGTKGSMSINESGLSTDSRSESFT